MKSPMHHRPRMAFERHHPTLLPLMEEAPWSPKATNVIPSEQNSLHQLLWPPRSNHRSTSGKSMRDTPSTTSLCQPLPPLKKRKVRFAAFDRIREFEPDHDDVSLWWSEDELAHSRMQERVDASTDPRAHQYVFAFRTAFLAISNNMPVSDEDLFVLMGGCNLGFSGLMNTICKEWQYARRLDVRCTIASVINMDRRLRLLSSSGLDVAEGVRIHYQTLTRPHRQLADVMGHANCIALYVD